MKKFKQGDQVIVITGKDSGKEGKITKVDSVKQRLIIDGINIVKRHVKPSQSDQQGGIREMNTWLHWSNVMHICPKTKKPTRIKIKQLENGDRIRVSKAGEKIGK